ncbi:RibD family protein [Picrophilus oshimae]|uniref:2,5-diamino-6-(5-phosphoribosylamino)pyrimidin-4(3H)-one reductase n=1 Tax=Picrophilus torridus (strain ATCC 700027 / DSM 9790 / JCM 10055 / NBRC 100828 / KAW 2/3) TaxID=1122961 RepID=A0A8G2FVT3_PICTO|nr:dihydrofolate reductase family protein [Picrophilus oshimae]SMD30397.1 2,5-diamino-6-(5-phosphoribosylamino)pyrimidin-4(3H)-one reductase [Picrophilus oshimae DSM 9789]
MRPYVIINVAMSLNGRISSINGSIKISDDYDWNRTIDLRKSVDAVLIGAGTVMVDNPELKHARSRIILDGNYKLNDNYKVFDGGVPTYIITGVDVSLKNVIVIKLNDLDMKNILNVLYEHGIKSILVEGGANVISQFFLNKLYDEFYIYINPGMILSGMPVFNGFEASVNYNILKLGDGILLKIK